MFIKSHENKKKKTTRSEVKTNGGLFYLPLSKTGSNGALLMVLLEEFNSRF